MHQECIAPEEWRAVVGYEGWYSVSSCGRVRRDASGRRTQAGRILKPTPTKDRRLSISLSRRGHVKRYLVHILVAAAFIGPLPAIEQVNHIDGNPSNNVATNLEYMTDLDNKAHAIRLGMICHGERRPEAVLTDEAVRAIRASLEPRRILAERYGVRPHCIGKVQRLERWKHVI